MIVWRNGAWEEADPEFESSGPRFGVGLYETILFNGKGLCHFKRHERRLQASLDALGLRLDGDSDLGALCREAVERNGLLGGMARVNIHCPARGEGGRCGVRVSARPYAFDPARSLRLWVSPDRHDSWLAAHKTMSAMHLVLARERAGRQGFDDALLAECSGLVQETSCAALLFHLDGKIAASASALRLASVAEAAARPVLCLERAEVRLPDLARCRHVYALNSLMGMRPVTAVGALRFEPDEAACAAATAAIHDHQA